MICMYICIVPSDVFKESGTQGTKYCLKLVNKNIAAHDLYLESKTYV